jgi:hypothetical protein
MLFQVLNCGFHHRNSEKKKLVEPQSDPYTLFLYALNSPVTRERYTTRLNWFFSKIGMAEAPIEERCKALCGQGERRQRVGVELCCQVHAIVQAKV